MSKFCVWACVMVSLCFGFPADAVEPASGGDMRFYDDLEFAHTPEKALALDLIVPAVPKPPLVIYIHGGSWINGSRKNPPMRWLAERGFAVASISYRFSGDAKFPAQIQDCRAAIRWLRVRAHQYGYEATKIGVIGVSAGAHLAVLLGTTAGLAEIEGRNGGTAADDSRVQAVVDFFGATDFLLRAETQPAKTDGPSSPVYRLLGSAPKDNERLAQLASGAFHVTPDDAPLLIYHGAKDATVLLDQSQRIEQAYREAGLEAALHIFPQAGHSLRGFMNDTTKSEIEEFLNQHLR